MAKAKVSLRDFPRLTRFYGIPPSELVRMPYALLQLYLDQLREIQSEEILTGILVSDMPHMTEAARKKVRRQFSRWAGADESAPSIDPRSAAGVAQAGALGIGIKLPATIQSVEEPDEDA